jgi:hypothetical protein
MEPICERRSPTDKQNPELRLKSLNGKPMWQDLSDRPFLRFGHRNIKSIQGDRNQTI